MQSGVTNAPAWMPNESKREYLDRLFDRLRASESGKILIVRLAQYLAEQVEFPDLRGWENTAEMLSEATRAVRALKQYLDGQEGRRVAEERRRMLRRQAQEERDRTIEKQQSLQALSGELEKLALEGSKADAGRKFERWFYSLMSFSEIIARPPYVTDGRQIDGSITVGDTTYLVECKFTDKYTGAPEVDIFRVKVESKADNTMGILVSISGFTAGAIDAASGRRTPLLLLDHGHLYRVLQGISPFRDVVERVRRHASQTGKAYLSAGSFDG